MPDILTKHLLSLIIFLPLLGAIVLLFFPNPSEEDAHDGMTDNSGKNQARANAVRYWSLFVTIATFVLSVVLLVSFDPKSRGYQFVEGPTAWVGSAKIYYHTGIDGISLMLVMLTTFLSALAVLFSFTITKRIKEYMAFLLILQTAMTGVFCALDLILFYAFWEAVLIPMYFLIGVWGHENRIYAAIKFFLYTFAGSVLMLVAIIFVYSTTGTFSLLELTNPANPAHAILAHMNSHTLMWVYAAFALAFMIKVPMFPFHTWLPDAHVEAPTAGSVILAGVMLKMGVYGFLRICLPVFPEQAAASAPLFITLAVIGIIFGAIVAAVQPDMKKLVAYSSVSHLGFVMLGIFTFTTLGLTGAVLQSVNHGVSTGMLFFLVGMLYDRRHTREIGAYGGIKRALPILSAFFMIAMVSSFALPLTNGFIGEFTILQGSLISSHSGWVPTAFAATGMVLSAIYMLWLFQRVFTGPLTKEENRTMKDLAWREKLVLAPLVVMVFWFGMYVSTWTRYLVNPVDNLVSKVPAQAESLVKKPARLTGYSSQVIRDAQLVNRTGL